MKKPIKAILALVLFSTLINACTETATEDNTSTTSDTTYSDGGNEEITPTLGEFSADNAGEEFNGIYSNTIIFAAMTSVLESEEIYNLIDSPSPPPSSESEHLPKSITNECVLKDIQKDSIILDYGNCDHARGKIYLDRIEHGKWLIIFEEGFSIFDLDIKGYILLVRKDQGLFSIFTSDSSGKNQGEEPVHLRWISNNTEINRELKLTGEIRSIESPAKYFKGTGNGWLIRSDVSDKIELIVGAASDAVQFPRPLDSKCPQSGTVSLTGKYSADISTTLSFDFEKQRYILSVNIGNISANGTINIKFDETKSSGIANLSFVANGPIWMDGKTYSDSLPVPRQNILDAIDKSNFDERVKEAIRTYIKNRDIISSHPLKDFESAINKILSSPYYQELCKI